MLPRTAWLALVVVMTLSLAFPVEASHCPNWWTSTSEVDTGTVPQAGRFYVDVICNESGGACPATGDFGPVEGSFVFAIYQESNGRNGLQRGDSTIDGTCHGRVPRDTPIFVF